MKQYEVEMSAMTCLGYTCCKSFITEVNFSVFVSVLSGGWGDIKSGFERRCRHGEYWGKYS